MNNDLMKGVIAFPEPLGVVFDQGSLGVNNSDEMTGIHMNVEDLGVNALTIDNSISITYVSYWAYDDSEFILFDDGDEIDL